MSTERRFVLVRLADSLRFRSIVVRTRIPAYAYGPVLGLPTVGRAKSLDNVWYLPTYLPSTYSYSTLARNIFHSPVGDGRRLLKGARIIFHVSLILRTATRPSPPPLFSVVNFYE